MITDKEIHEMSLDQKLRVMETIWEDIRQSEGEIPSPDWHREELEETERRRKEGLEEPIDWERAKEQLRRRDDEV